jgi:hypothetical protein
MFATVRAVPSVIDYLRRVIAQLRRVAPEPVEPPEWLPPDGFEPPNDEPLEPAP